MVIPRDQMHEETRSNMRGGDGEVRITRLVDELPHGRLLAEISIPPGCGIGEHPHDGETEYYLVISGAGVVVDDGAEVRIGRGDVVVTGGGASHAIRATGESPLVFTALIITH